MLADNYVRTVFGKYFVNNRKWEMSGRNCVAQSVLGAAFNSPSGDDFTNDLRLLR
jgi:hypothetical protein